MSHIRCRTHALTIAFVSTVVAVVASLFVATATSAQSPINQWRRWETTITAARNYTTGRRCNLATI